MPRPPEFSKSDNEYSHIRCLIANIHKPRNVSRPPVSTDSPLEVVRESPTSSDTEASRSESERSERSEKCEARADPSDIEEGPPTQRAKSNSFAGAMLTIPPLHNKRRRPSFLHLSIGSNSINPGPLSAGNYLNVPRFTVTAPPGEQRRHSHGFPFHGFALRRHSNTVCDSCT